MLCVFVRERESVCVRVLRLVFPDKILWFRNNFINIIRCMWQCPCCNKHLLVVHSYSLVTHNCFSRHPDILKLLLEMMGGEQNVRVMDNMCAAICRMVWTNSTNLPLEYVRLHSSFPCLFACHLHPLTPPLHPPLEYMRLHSSFPCLFACRLHPPPLWKTQLHPQYIEPITYLRYLVVALRKNNNYILST